MTDTLNPVPAHSLQRSELYHKDDETVVVTEYLAANANPKLQSEPGKPGIELLDETNHAAPIPADEVKRWLEMAKSSRLLLKRITQAVQQFQEVDWKEELETLRATIDEEEVVVNEIFKAISSRVTDPGASCEPQDGEDVETQSVSSSDTHTTIEEQKELSIPTLNYVPWTEVKTIKERTPVHHAIDIPYNEPTNTDILSEEVEGDAPGTGGKTKAENQPPRPEKLLLPERIRISSHRLQRFLDYGLSEGGLSCNSGTPLHILRPFKLLFYHENMIRSHLAEWERARRRLEEKTEEEYSAEFDQNPVPDNGEGYPEDPTDKDVLQLTGLIRDTRCLLEFMDNTLIPEQKRIANGPENVRFSDLWFLFPQGSLIFSKDRNIPQQVWRVIQRTGGRRYLSQPTGRANDYRTSFSPFVIDCYHLDYDGTRYCPIYHQFEINEFDGMQSVQSLQVIPLIVAEREPKLIDRDALLARGREFISYTTNAHHRYYSGRSYHRTTYGRKLSDLTDGGNARNVSQYPERVDSEVIVDFARAIQEVPWWRPNDNDPEYSFADSAETGDDTGIDRDSSWDQKFRDEFMEQESRKWRLWEKTQSVPQGEDLLLLPDRVFAFVLRSRRWACLQIGTGPEDQKPLRKPKQPHEPWNDLKLLPNMKKLVQSLIESHFSPEYANKIHFDPIKDKGKGVIILLHGVPGVGKTSTAECAAKHNNRPLLPITCGDLGLDPVDVETNLQDIFRLAQSWGCILLLDEADIFLAQRTVSDMRRNALVSVFLRSLEYYQGILFLTTNRVGVFDEAFKSRIHISLYYPPLAEWQTYEIWEAHIRKAEEAGIKADKRVLMDFARNVYNAQKVPKSGPVWNGRQIRNAFQSALALAVYHSKPGESISLDLDYFQRVFEVSDRFSNYIWKVRQENGDAEWNKMTMVRRDDFVYVPVNLDALNTTEGNAGQHHASFNGWSPGAAGSFSHQASPLQFHHHNQQSGTGVQSTQLYQGATGQGYTNPFDAGGLHFSQSARTETIAGETTQLGGQSVQSPQPVSVTQASFPHAFQGPLPHETAPFPGRHSQPVSILPTSRPQQQQHPPSANSGSLPDRNQPSDRQSATGNSGSVGEGFL